MRNTVIWKLLFASLAAATSANEAFGADCRESTFKGLTYIACDVHLAKDRLEIYYRDESHALIGTFDALERRLAKAGRQLVFAMNGGMFEESGDPVGLLLINGTTLHEINLNGWPDKAPVPAASNGNFFVLPNGVFWTKNSNAAIANSANYSRTRPSPDQAIQSGPMLLENGKMPLSLERYNSPSFKRNGVCTGHAGVATFAISNQSVSIRQFAEFMRDGLSCKDALYLDGCRSALFSREMARSDLSCPSATKEGTGLPMGSIVGVSISNPTPSP